MADSYKISLGIDFNDGELKNIKKQLTNLTDNTHRVRIDIDNSRLLKQIEHAKKELRELNSAKGNQPSLTVNTQSLEKSLSRVADVIEEVRKSLGTLDDKSGMKSLLSSVNQIATALGKVENESDNLVKSLSALSKKDFSINFDLKMGKSASQISSEQGDIKRDTISQLKQQAKALEDYLDQYYKVAQRQEGVVKLTQGTNLFSSFWEMSPNIGNTKASLKQQVSTYKQYIDLMQEAAKIKGVDLSSVTSGFSKTTNDIVEETKKVSDGVEEAKQALKGIFGGSLDVEGLSGQLQPIIADLGEIKTALQSLSSNNAIDGLTQSFNRLSETLEKLTANLTLAKNTLDTGFSNTAPANNVVRTAQQTGQKIGETISKSARQSVKQSINLDDVIDEQVLDLMETFSIAGDKGSNAFKEIRQALVECRNELNILKNSDIGIDEEVFDTSRAFDKVSDAIANQIRAVNSLGDEYVELAKYMKSFNDPKKGNKVRVPDFIKQEQGDDYKSTRGTLGIAFNTEKGISFASFIEDLNHELGIAIDLTNGEEKAYEELVHKLRLGREQLEAQKKSQTSLQASASTDDILAQNYINKNEIRDVAESSIDYINAAEAAEKAFAQASTQSANTVAQNEERKQQAYQGTRRLVSGITQEAIDNVSSQSIDKAFRVDESDSIAFRREMENLVSQWTNAKGELTDIKINTSTFFDGDTGRNIEKITSAIVTYNNELGETIKKTIALRQIDTKQTGEKYDKKLNRNVPVYEPVYGFVEVSGQYSKSLGKTKVQTDAFVKQQKNAVADLTNTINQLNRSAIDPNAGKPIKDSSHLESLASQYKRITDAIEKMGRTSNDNDFQEERNNVKALISEYKSLTREYKNAETSATSFRSKDIGTIKSTYASDLDVLIQKMKDAGVYTSGFEKGAENLRNALNNATDTSGINAFLNGFDKLEAGYKRAAQYAKSSEKATTYGKRAQGLAESIKNIQRISPEINEFEVEINGAKVSVESLLKSLSQVKTKGDFDSANEDLKVFKKSAEAAGIAIRETAKEANSDYNKLKSLAKEMGKVDIELAKVDNVDDFNSLKRLANDLEAEFKDLYDSIGKNLNADQLRELDQIFANTTGEVRELNNELAKSAETKELTAGFERLKTIAKEINSLKIDIFKFEDADNIERASNQLNELENEAAELRATLQQKFNIQSFDEIDNIARQGEEALNSLIAKAEEAKAKLAKSIKVDIEVGNFDNEMDTMIAKFNSLSDANIDLRNSVNTVEQAYKEMLTAVNANTGDEVADRERLIQAEKEYAAALEKTNNLIKIQARADKVYADAQKLQDNRDVFQSKIDVWMEKNSAATKKFGAELLALRAKAETADQVELNHLEKELLKIDKAADKAGLKMQSMGDQIKSKFKEYMAYFSVAEVFMYVEQGLREMFNTVKEIDTAMTGLYRVTDLTASQYDTLFNNMISSAKEYGATLNDIINATTDWVRAGFDADVALGMAEVTTMYQHISDLDYDTAAENLITAYNGFKNELLGLYDGDEVGAVRYIADVLNELDNNFAVTSAGLGEALKRSASALDLAGNSIQETAGMVTGIAEVTQDPEKAGNALKVLSLRLRGMKGQLEELGEETDENVENISKMQGQILNMTKGKVNIFDGAGNFKSTYEIMKGIAEVWDDLSSIDQADLLETIAGKHRANDVAALLSNWKNVEAAVKSASEAEGSAARENAKYIDSIQGRLDKLTTVWQSFANTFMSSDFLKGAVSALTEFVELVEKLVKTLGSFGTIGLGAGIFGLFKNRKGIFGDLSAFGSLALEVIGSSDKLGTKFKNLGKAAGAAGGSITKGLTSSLSGMVGAIGLVVAGIGLAINAYKKHREEISKTRQEVIQSSDEFLNASNSFEQAYIKYSGKTNLTAEEEAELESAINGTVDALDDKSNKLHDVVNSSNDYVAALEAITDAELKAAEKAAQEKQKNAKLELEDATKDWYTDNTARFQIKNDSTALKIAKEMDTDFLQKETKGKKGHHVSTYWFDMPSNADADKILDYYYTLVEYKNKLLEVDDFDVNKEVQSAYEDVNSTIEKLSDTVKVYEDGLYDLAKAEYQAQKGIPKTTEEYLKMREAILTRADIARTNFDTRKTIAGSLDSEYSQAFDLTSSYAQSRKLIGLLDEYGDTEAGQIEAFLNMRTAVNNKECTVGDYISQFDDINEMTKYWSDEAKEELNTSFGIDTDTIKKQYDEVVKSYMRSFDPASGNLAGIQENFEKNFLDGLSASELAAVVSLKTEIDWQNDSFDDIVKQIEEEAALIEAISFSVDIEFEAEKLESLSTAISESVSGAGLSTESISLVEDMFGDLDSYDKSALFERTANGIRLNSDELRKLNNEYKKTNVDGLDNKIDALGEKYNQTKEELYSLTYGTDEYNDKARELSDIEAQINATEKLAAQYSGLASAYQEWQRVESSGSQRDMYEGMIEGFETVGDEISRGWLDDGTIEFLELIKGEKATIIDGKGAAKEIDIATASAQELKQVWKDLDKNIKHTSYSVRDFFTVDEDGNSTSQGVYNFLDAIGQMEEEKFGGKDVVKRKDGKIIGFDFQIAGGDKAIAEALGISEELVQIMKRAADDAGFVVSMDGTYQQLDVLKKKAAEAAKELKETFKATEYTFFQDGSEKGIKKDYDEALKVWETFKKNKKEDGTIDMSVKGAEEAYTLVSTLQSMVDQLSEPVYMELNTSQVEKDMQTPLSKLQEYETLVQTEHQLQLKGTDTSQIEADKETIIDYFDELQENSPEIAAKLGIKDLSREEIQAKVEAGEIEIPATIDLQVEMNNTLRDMVNVALYNAGLIDKEELETRVDIKLYADEIDISDVEEKTDDAVENADSDKSVVEKKVEVNLTTDNTPKLPDILDNYSLEEQTVVLKFIADSSDVENYTLKDKEVVVKFIADTIDVDGYTPEEKKAYAKYLVDGGDLDAYTPEEKQAIVKYLNDTGEPDNYTPEEKKAIAKFIKDSGEVDGYTPAEKQAIAKFIKDSLEPDSYVPSNKDAVVNYYKDSSIPDGYTPTNPNATVTYLKDSSSVDTYDPPNFTRYVTYYAKKAFSTAAEKGKKALENRFGIVNGTANSDGAAFVGGTGRAFKQGDWRTKKTETALTGELGREIVVTPQNRWYTVGDNGAEFVNIPRGSIVFNHRQTEELLRNGKATSDGGRAKALVNGSAFLGGTAHRGEGEWVGVDVPSFKVGYDYKASSSDSDSKKSQEIFDWIEVAIERIEREIDNLDRTANNVYKSWSSRNKALASEISEVGNEIALQEKAYQGYMNAANEIGLSSEWKKKVQSGAIDIDNITDDVLKEKIDDYQKWYEKALDCKDAIEELREQESKLYAQRFENVQAQYDGILQGYEHTEAMLNEYISQAEEQGYIVSKKYYNALIDNEQQSIDALKKEQADLIAERDKAVAEGKITKGSEEWLKQCAAIDSVTQAIEEGETAILSYGKAMKEIDWEIFDLKQQHISDVTAESDFLIELMSNKDLYDDKGNLTEQGAATMGLHGLNYNTHMYQADDYGAEIADIDRRTKLSKDHADYLDPNSKDVINRRRELIELQRESILAAESEKNAIKDLVEDGINLELDALQERIDLHNEELDSMKDLYDYQNKVADITREISNLEKQRLAYSGDDSEEAKQKLQQITVELQSSRQELEEAQYDKYIADQQAMLDELYNQYSEVLNTRLDDTNYLLSQVIDGVNATTLALGEEGAITNALGVDGAIASAIANAMGENGSIKNILNKEVTDVGTKLSGAMNNIWSVGEGNAKSVLTMYGEGFQNKQTTTNQTLSGIKVSIDRMVDDVDKDAQKKVETPKTKPSSVANTTKSNNGNKGNNKGNKQPSKPAVTDDTIKGIAASIWVYGKDSGWGNNPFRENKLTDKLGAKNAKKVQDYVNKYGSSGGLYKVWVDKNKNLSQYSYAAFATGAKKIDESQLAWTQENGKEFIVRPSDGAILTPIAKGDSVLNAMASNNIWDMANSPAEFIRDNLGINSANVPNAQNVNNNITQHFENITFSMPNVHGYNDLLTEMQRDPKFEKLVLSMTIDQIAGKSKLAKGKSIRN